MTSKLSWVMYRSWIVSDDEPIWRSRDGSMTSGKRNNGILYTCSLSALQRAGFCAWDHVHALASYFHRQLSAVAAGESLRAVTRIEHGRKYSWPETCRIAWLWASSYCRTGFFLAFSWRPAWEAEYDRRPFSATLKRCPQALFPSNKQT